MEEEKKNISNTPYTDYYKKKSETLFSKNKLKQRVENLEETAKKVEKKIEVTPVREEKKPEYEIEESPAERPEPASKISKVITTVIVIIILALLAYFILASLFPNKVPSRIFIISAQDSQIFSTSGGFYIDDNGILGEKENYQETIIRPIISSRKFNLVFKPKQTIQPSNAALSLDLVILNNSEIFLADKLIFPNLDYYYLMKETNDDYLIYARKNITNSTNETEFSEYDSASEFLYANFPNSSIWSISNPGSELIVQNQFNYQDFVIIDGYNYDKDSKFFSYEKNIEVTGDDRFSLGTEKPNAVAIESITLELI